jgi:hypothetical protein
MMFFMSNVLLASMIQGKSNSLHRQREEETGFAELHSIVRGGHQRRKRLLRKAPPLLSPRAARHGPVFLIHLPCFFSYCATNYSIVFEVEFPFLKNVSIGAVPTVLRASKVIRTLRTLKMITSGADAKGPSPPFDPCI